MCKFERLEAGLFWFNTRVYVKLAQPTEEYNAVALPDGTFEKIDADAQCYPY